MLGTRIVLMGLALLAAVVSGCRGAPCISSAQCGDGVCSGGICRERGSSTSSSSGSLFGDGGVRRDAGVTMDAGAVDAAGLDAAGVDAAGQDAGPTPDAAGRLDGAVVVDSGPFIITTTNPASALAINETGTQLLVASAGNVGSLPHLDTFQLPYSGAAPLGLDLAVQVANTCVTGVLISRGNLLYTGCSTSPFAVRAFNAANGMQLGEDNKFIQSSPLGLNHANMVAVVSGTGNGGIVFNAPTTDGTRFINAPNADMNNAGVGFVENAVGNVVAAVTMGGTVSDLRYWSVNAMAFNLEATITLGGLASAEFITSGPRGIQANQPVVVASATLNQVVVFNGSQLTAAAGGAQLVAVNTYNSANIPNVGALRMKISQDGIWAYEFNRGGTQLCRYGVQPGASPNVDCVDLPGACSPSDVAARVRTSPTFVACAGINQVVAYPGF